ncbi:jg17738 [Pararge aegeria aegeria]|uniref:Jg17738 protein n=1 Tax=Pararge aegeria aegeria TaxID=348720 RepID=A0A8S4S3G9_9NEOP|nr:jg17738 [Pararge aegeria aegeria]
MYALQHIDVPILIRYINKQKVKWLTIFRAIEKWRKKREQSVFALLGGAGHLAGISIALYCNGRCDRPRQGCRPLQQNCSVQLLSQGAPFKLAYKPVVLAVEFFLTEYISTTAILISGAEQHCCNVRVSLTDQADGRCNHQVDYEVFLCLYRIYSVREFLENKI